MGGNKRCGINVHLGFFFSLSAHLSELVSKVWAAAVFFFCFFFALPLNVCQVMFAFMDAAHQLGYVGQFDFDNIQARGFFFSFSFFGNLNLIHMWQHKE